jgi:methylenetetrahydrofolate dehydrogenase (NADP+)/methenyltetrahydrofolate cyclohydrolase
MNAQLIDGKRIREKILHQVNQEVARLKNEFGGVPGLAILRVGDDPASIAYIRQKKLAAEGLGFDYREYLFPEAATSSAVSQCIRQLNRDSSVHGILLQLPLPPHLNPEALVAVIDPEKDVDGLHPVNAGRLFQGLPGLRPCTPSGVMHLLEEIRFDLSGKTAVIVGRSNIVGKPMAMLLLAANATATICHRQSDLPAALAQADLVVAAAGMPDCIKGRWIKPGAVVIDVGINRMEGKLVGDVEFREAAQRASFITPVPGGVGAITVAMLMRNTLQAWAHQHQHQHQHQRELESESAITDVHDTDAWPSSPAAHPLYGQASEGSITRSVTKAVT